MKWRKLDVLSRPDTLPGGGEMSNRVPLTLCGSFACRERRPACRSRSPRLLFAREADLQRMSRRTDKIGSAIRQEVSRVIMRELNDPRLDGLLPSVNRVKVAEDLSTAD